LRGNGHRVGSESADIDSQLAERLGRIDEQARPALSASLRVFVDGKHSARFVVHPLNGDERIGAQVRCQLIEARWSAFDDAERDDLAPFSA
jgi:hypothetical protein